MKTIQTDVLVCGGVCRGIADALSAAGTGAKTLLIERAGFSGGTFRIVSLPRFEGWRGGARSRRAKPHRRSVATKSVSYLTILCATVALRLAVSAEPPVAAPASPGQSPKLAPGAVLRFEFPDLPDTLESVDSGKKQPAVLSARLPDDYTRDRTFPLFVYLLGGAGGRGEERDLRLGSYVIGKRDWIVAALPLFKTKVDPGEMSRGLMVSMDDYQVIAASYRAMLERLYAAVPNIVPERSTFGGHSNGAHTTGVLLAMQDEFLLAHFRQFFLHEGGIGPLFANVLQKRAMRGPRFLVMMGSRSWAPKSADEAPLVRLPQILEAMTRRGGLDFNFVTMEGYGHEQPPEYLRVVGQWARGEPLEDVPAKVRALATALTLPLKTHPDSSAWPDLIAADNSNMRCEKSGVWSVRDGVLTATEDVNLWTKDDYGDCVVDLEFRFEAGANSGVFFYLSDEKQWMPHSVEIQICDDAAPQWQAKPATWHAGAFFGHQAPTKSAVKPAGEWNRMTITCQGARITVLLNGDLVNEIDLTRWTDGAHNPDGSEVPSWLRGQPWATLPHRGKIGFQGRHAGAGIEFRSAKVLLLAASTESEAAR